MRIIVAILLSCLSAFAGTVSLTNDNGSVFIFNASDVPLSRIPQLPVSSATGNMATATNSIHYQVINVTGDYAITAGETNGMYTTNLVYVVNTMASNVALAFPMSFINTFTVFNVGTNWVVCTAANGNSFLTFPASGGLTYSTSLNNKYVGKSQTFLMINQTNYIVSSDFRPLSNIIFDVTNNIASVSGTNGSNGTNGLNGATGAQGIQGIQGLNGTNAATGLATNEITTNTTITIAALTANQTITVSGAYSASGATTLALLPTSTFTNTVNTLISNNPSGFISSIPASATNWIVIQQTNGFLSLADTNTLKAQAGSAIAGSNYLVTIPTAATNQFLVTIPVAATNQFLVTVPVGATNWIVIQSTNGMLSLADTNTLKAQAGASIAGSNYLVTLAAAMTNQFLVNIAAGVTNGLMRTNSSGGLWANTVTASNGIATFATNSTVVSTSTTISNNQSVQMMVWLTGATGLSMTNAYGTNVFRGQSVTVLTPFILQPRAQLVGSSIVCVGTNGL